jgi:membrane-bound lytic murein transglycosylase D
MRLRTSIPVAILVGAWLGVVSADATRNLARHAAAAAADPSEASAEPVTTWDIPIVRNEYVDRFVRMFVDHQSDRMALYLRRSGQYEGMIRRKLRERGMPEDLLYLSMIESGFNPTARSPAAAVGLWQFIPDTGRRYGLRIDGYVDERRDPEKSTDAALRHLEDLYRQFGSWYLAAAAYNSGAGRVSRVMREVTGADLGAEEDFWRIRDRLPRETRDYVPLIVAAAIVGKEPERYGLEDVERRMPLPSETVTVPGGVALEVAARAAGVGEGDIRSLNPELLRGTTPPGREYELRIPAGRTARFASEFDRAAAEARALALQQAEAKRAADARAAASRAAAARRAASGRTHTVRQGESLSVIARRHGTSVGALQRANGMGRNTVLQPGQRLRVPGR